MGNPLALLELPGRGGHGSAYERILRSFAERIAALPEPRAGSSCWSASTTSATPGWW
ncbi:hypothetical protein ACFQY7_37295 [Actinomadura luteofluorescens]|uniref:hypothetical protein n=1 Tax=Actinomadura luteofluorescens TaxID=46163 RepID=UPI00363B3CD3